MPGAVVDKAIIVGGGIGGLAAALAFHKLGINATVYERSMPEERLQEAGTLVILAPNGLQALHAINPDIPLKLKERGSGCTLTCMCSEKGEKLREVPMPYRGLAIQWSVIVNTLAEFLPPSCIKWGFTVAGLAEVDGQVEVTAVKGGETTVDKAPLLVGADGVQSRVRDFVLSENPVKAEDMGRQGWRAMIPTPAFCDAIEENLMMSILAGDKNALITRLDVGMTYWAIFGKYVAVGAERSTSKDEMKARAKSHFPDFDLLQAVIEATDAGSIVERRIYELHGISTWSKGRVVLLGDAVHAISPAVGQGANLALEDALELARQLLSSGSIEEALANYVAERQPRVKAISEINQKAITIAYNKRNSEDDKDSPRVGTLVGLNDLIENYPRLSAPLIPS